MTTPQHLTPLPATRETRWRRDQKEGGSRAAPRVSVAHRRRLMTDLGGGGAAGEHGDVLDPLRSRLDRVAHERECAPLALHHELLLVERTCAAGHGLSGCEQQESASPALIELAAACAGPGSSPAGQQPSRAAAQPGSTGRCGVSSARARTNKLDRCIRDLLLAARRLHVSREVLVAERVVRGVHVSLLPHAQLVRAEGERGR